MRAARHARIALIGLRGAGKSTLGKRLADDLGYAFIELSREIEKFAGCGISEIHNLYGAHAYRRYERRALEEAIQIYPEVVIATPGGLVSDSANFNLHAVALLHRLAAGRSGRPHVPRRRAG
jgi:XRE family aerobic/anaerobic benzoate catabolism transcriptional regulator